MCDPLFPHADEHISKISYCEKMDQLSYKKSVNNWVDICYIMPKNASGKDLGMFTAHFFRRGGAQHRFITDRKRWSLGVVKLWGLGNWR